MGNELPSSGRVRPWQHLYNGAWRRARAQFLFEHPLCWMCEQDKRLVAAQVVDHDPPHKGDPAKFWDESTWRPLCKPHHDSTKQKQERTGRIVGCDASGTPLDPNHHWTGQH